MATQNVMDTLSPEYQSQLEEQMRKREIARMLMQQGFKGPIMPEQGRQASKLSPIAAIAPMIQAFLGQRQASEADKRMGEIQSEAAASTQKTIDELMNSPEEQKQQMILGKVQLTYQQL